jgi:hypothetical protein
MPLPNQSTEPNQPNRQQAESTGFYLQVLHELINMGTDLARAVHQQATAEPAAGAAPTSAATPDSTIAFDRIARTIRRTIALARHVAEPLPERAARPDITSHDAAQHRTAARKQIIRAVEDAIESKVHGAACMDEEEADGLRAELMDRLDGPDLDHFDLNRPVADHIADIRRDLGLAAAPPGMHPWKRRTPDDIAILCARAAAPRPPPAPPSVVWAASPDAWPGSDPISILAEADTSPD